MQSIVVNNESKSHVHAKSNGDNHVTIFFFFFNNETNLVSHVPVEECFVCTSFIDVLLSRYGFYIDVLLSRYGFYIDT